MLKNTGSDNYAKVRDFAREQQICLLTGTPLSVPLDGYAMIKLVEPDHLQDHDTVRIHPCEGVGLLWPTEGVPTP